MKTKTLTQMRSAALALLCVLLFNTMHAQIQLQGLISENEGAASWNADGTGPEPYGVGHGTFTYYIASRDYVNPSATSGAHFTSIGIDFPLFAQALIDNGFTTGQVKLKLGLASLGNDIEGEDWFTFGNEHYLNFYPINTLMTLNGEPMISGSTNYIMFHYGTSTGWTWQMESNFFVPADASGNSSAAVKAVAAAFLLDVAGQELRFNFQSLGSTVPLTGNGRTGSYYNINGSIEKGRHELPFNGLAVNHEGFAGWDADGTGPESKGDGHSTQKYYITSRDFDGIDPDPNAGFARLLSENGSGFQNFVLQLQYRGFTPEQVKFKMGLRDIGEDIEGEDWSLIAGIHHVNFYQSKIIAYINGEPLFGFVCDTAKTYQNVYQPALGWWGETAQTLVFDASENSSAAVKAVAASFFKDMQDRQIQTVTTLSTYANQTFSGNGRLNGGFWQINAAKLVALPPKGTLIESSEMSGTWNMAGHPYIVTSDITVPNGQTLIIEPGVWVKFTDRVKFKVQGTIFATGDTSNTGSIVFTAANPDLGWGHFEFDQVNAANEVSKFKHCIFEWGSAALPVPWNQPYNCGGAIAVRDTDGLQFENCLFHHNKALDDGYYTAGGGAIGLWNSSPVIRNCVFMNNSGNWSGAISCAFGSSPDIVNCLFYGNKSLKNSVDGGGAMLVAADANPRLLNNTFVKNHSNYRGGALEIYNGSNPVLINNIFWGNTAPQNSQILISSNDCNVDFKYNDIEGGQAGIGPYGIGSGVYENNLDVNPSFADALALNFRLSHLSPCVDAGIPNVTGLNLPPCDLSGNVRIWDGDGNGSTMVDMGVYEYGAPPYIPPLFGDANCDGNVNVLDVVTIVNCVIGQNPQPFCFDNADIDSNGLINVLDVIGTLNIILGGSKSGCTEATLTPAIMYFSEGKIVLQSEGNIAGLQFEIIGLQAGQLKLLLPGYVFAGAAKDNRFTGLIYSLNNTPLPTGKIKLFSISGEANELHWGKIVAGNCGAEAVKVFTKAPDQITATADDFFSVYPNPSGGEFNIVLQQEALIEVYDLMGALIRTYRAGSYHTLDLSAYSKGVYMLKVSADGLSWWEKLVIK